MSFNDLHKLEGVAAGLEGFNPLKSGQCLSITGRAETKVGLSTSFNPLKSGQCLSIA